MADLRITELAALAGANLAAGDLLPIADISASETKKITVTDLVGTATTLIADATIPGAKILFSSNTVAGSALQNTSVTATQLADDSVTAAKLANESTVDLVTTLPASGAFTGQLALDTDDLKVYCWDGSSWQSIKAAGSVNSVIGSSAGLVNISISTSGDEVTITTSLDNTAASAQFLAGPSGSAGAVSYRTIAGADLPTATTTTKGAVSVDGNGLTLSGTEIQINNTVAPNTSNYYLTQYEANGLVTAGRAITAADLPAALAGTLGAVFPGSGLAVTAGGQLNHSNTVGTGTFTKVTVDAQGHVSAGTTLVSTDIPSLSTDKLTSGELPADRIGNSAVTGTKLANYSVSLFGNTEPTAEHIGQFFFNPLTRDLYLWDGNVYQPIGISIGEIVFAGTFDASAGSGTGLVASVTADGTAIGLTVGSALPAAAVSNNRYYLVVSEAGTITSGNAPQVALSPPDIVLSNGNAWTEVDVSQTVTAQVASNVSFTPAGSISATNVQTALQEVDSEKLAVAGGTVTGELLISETGSLVFEGSSANAFETTLAVTDPTADRTVTLPNVSGTVVTTGDTGSVTSTMILDGTILNGDINASAAIADTKLATISTASKVSNSATTAASANTASAIVARDASGNFAAGTITAALTGNASTASTLATARNIQGVSFDGSAAITVVTAGSGISVTGTAVANTGVLSVNSSTGAITNVAKTDTAQSFTAAQRGAITALTDGATITPDFAVANNFSVTLGGSRTLANPSNLTAGASGCIWITQDGTGSRTLAYGSQWDFTGGTAPTLTTTAAAVDCLVYSVQSSTQITATLITNLS